MVVQGWTQQSTTDTRCLMYRHACCKHVQPLGQGCAYLCLVDVVLVDRRVEAGEAIANVLLKEVAATDALSLVDEVTLHLYRPDQPEGALEDIELARQLVELG